MNNEIYCLGKHDKCDWILPANTCTTTHTPPCLAIRWAPIERGNCKQVLKVNRQRIKAHSTWQKLPEHLLVIITAATPMHSKSRQRHTFEQSLGKFSTSNSGETVHSVSRKSSFAITNHSLASNSRSLALYTVSLLLGSSTKPPKKIAAKENLSSISKERGQMFLIFNIIDTRSHLGPLCTINNYNLHCKFWLEKILQPGRKDARDLITSSYKEVNWQKIKLLQQRPGPQ